ncbi:uncharacterized protein [Blastocystis hominis]|uniref:Uncharacterized protein n=1 Tax=Blastocystis hominis TaxID=12968 RepID=D8M662_BLAHO|nr:uncharacterized protein [Blastocystis hominis]CBK23771.2 unnamed protein product [Blastocystis hominis]|eukprot:XP_012897819.1 uncharacterized protein [Blastocystis hominis]
MKVVSKPAGKREVDVFAELGMGAEVKKTTRISAAAAKKTETKPLEMSDDSGSSDAWGKDDDLDLSN